MQLEPKDLFEKLEFDKILTLLESECLGELGKEVARQLPVHTDVGTILRELNEAWECRLGHEQGDGLPLAVYEDLAEDLKYLNIEDYVLPEDGWQRILAVLRTTGRVFDYFTTERKEAFPHLYDIIRPIDFDPELPKAIDRVFDEEGNVRPDASPGLGRIRRMIVSKQREVDRVFRSLIQGFRERGWLTDNVESIRNGRRVLSVPSEHKRKIRGIIHDESATGRTAFIEPEKVIEINNDVFDLQQEERREIWRILKELSATFRPYREDVQSFLELLVRLDVVYAKARLAGQMNGGIPRVREVRKPVPASRRDEDREVRGRAHLGIQMGKHPLLILKNKKEGKEVVPFDLTLFGQNRIVVLSGPNAGGKSILMKSVGLIQIMFQAGMLVPVDDISEMGVFEKIMADIGDQQSIEDDLSTYSSRLRNMRIFLENADEKTLVLIDEFGSGTDPKMGGAIAEAILKELNERRVFGVITTHYSNLKLFAFRTRGIVNGSMLFDKEELSPTYMFKVGRPGSSYAFEIAEKSGLPKRILGYARKRSGKNEVAVDTLLIDLQREKKEVEDKLAAMTEREKKLQRLIKNYEQLQLDLEYRRKKFKLESKAIDLQQTARENKELQKLVREIRETQNLEKAKELAVQVREERKELETEISQLNEEVYEVPRPRFKAAKAGEIAVGDFVKMRNGNATGKVESVDRKKAIVQMGQMRMTVKLRDLEHAREPLETKPTKSVKTDTFSQNAAFETKLDIRGMKMEDAVRVVQDYLDRAMMTSAAKLEIVHGKGTGVLRKVVRDKLREYQVSNWFHPPGKEGGDGVTVIEF